MPKRIVIHRTAGWHMPKGAVWCARKSRWGNPFKQVNDIIYADASHRRKILDPWVFYCAVNPNNHTLVIDLFIKWVNRELPDDGTVRPCPFTIEDIKRELGGRDLACFCKLNKPCHVDYYLQVANSK